MEITHNFDVIIRRMMERAKDYRTPLVNFYGYMLRQTEQTFSKLGKKGNSTPFRTVLWKWFADQYTRKDGTVVPAYGEPPRVKGRLRHSGKRVKQNDKVMQDRGTLKQFALSEFKVGSHFLEADTPVKYADEQQKMRPFAFFVQQDTDVLKDLIIKYLVE